MDPRTQLWLDAHARLVREVGRVVAHGLRGHLNGIGLAVALAEQVAAGDLPGADAVLAQAVRTGRQEAGRAETAAARLQALVSDAFSPVGVRLDLAARWAVALVAPVAEERGVRVTQSVDPGAAAIDDLAVMPPGAREALGLWLLTAIDEVARGGEVAVRVTPGTAAVHWPRVGDAGDDVLAREFAACVPGVVAELQVPADGNCSVRLHVA